MLLQFSVSNFLSFDEEVIFSLLADMSDKSHPDHLIPGAASNSRAALRTSVLYGPNGSGKSNFVEAIRFAQNLIARGTRALDVIPIRSFKLGSKLNNQQATFEFIYQTDGVLYTYGFSVLPTRICEEWLLSGSGRHEQLLFRRITTDEHVTTVEMGEAPYRNNAHDRERLVFIAEGTRQNQLFLTEAIERNVTRFRSAYIWFVDKLLTVSAEWRTPVSNKWLDRGTTFTAFLTQLLKASGTGVDQVRTREVPIDLDTSISVLTTIEREAIRNKLAMVSSGEFIEVGVGKERYFFKKGSSGEAIRIELELFHRSSDDTPVPFRLDEESEGTQRLLDIAPLLLALKHDSESVVILDEIDRRLHTHVSRFILETFFDSDEAHRQNQLIVTTHDTNLQDLDLLRRDEIWFAEKNVAGATRLYSLAEFKVRPDLRIEKSYLNGRFGAVPQIGPTPQIFDSRDAQIDALNAGATR